MRLVSRRRLHAEGLETRLLLAVDIIAEFAEAYVESADHENSPPAFVTGDANRDSIFDQADLVEVLQAGKYLTDQTADWSQGDWNGDSVFNSRDLVLALQSSNYIGEGLAAKGVQTNDSANTVRLPAGSSDGDLAVAIIAAGPRGTVIVEAGMHTESSSVMITEPVTIVGEEGAVFHFDTAGSNAFPVAVDAGLHIKNTQQVRIQGLDIRPVNAVGGTAILVEGSNHVSIEYNAITDFQFGVLVESADHSVVAGNLINATSAWLTGQLSIVNGINVVNGFGNQLRNNSVNGAAAGIFVSGENGKILDNTVSENFIGVLLCTNASDSFQLPDGRLSGAEFPATRWLVQGNTSINNFGEGYLVIDGANNNTLTNNEGGNNGTYDIELATDTARFGFLAPASFENKVNAGSHKDIVIKDCGNDDKVHGGIQVDTDIDTCS